MKVVNKSGSIPVPRAFFEKFIDDMSFNEVKVYLYLISLEVTEEEPDVMAIALKLSLTVSEVYKILKSLDDLGLIVFCNETGREEIVLLSSPVKKSQGQKPKNAQIIATAEQIKGSPLSSSEAELLFFIKDNLSFSDELISYLLEYCKERNAFNISYIRTVALKWHEKGIDTVEKAKESSRAYDDIVYMALERLGRKGVPTKAEADFIMSFKENLGMSDELILYACDLTSIGTDKNRLKYALSILDFYKRNGIDTVDKAKSFKLQKKGDKAPSNRFTNFEQLDYDFEALENLLIEN